MAFPGCQEFMYPFLKILEDGKEHLLREAYNRLADEFSVSEEEREELLPSGKQRVFHNRIGWTRTYLNKAGLLETVRRGVFVITERGRQVLVDSNVESINNAFLMQFEEF
ncbi:winged helix-turn-helix domain-containing protein [Planococcus liqunii]|uniref:winged helix-turn-helix domain-containing protein n=1 Tax=Planococcus liqunii TaxID=3058394 RepID=UPI003462A42E